MEEKWKVVERVMLFASQLCKRTAKVAHRFSANVHFSEGG